MSITVLIGLSIVGSLSLLCLSYVLSDRWERRGERRRPRAARFTSGIGAGAAVLCAVSIVALVLDLSGARVGSSSSSTPSRSARQVSEDFCDTHKCVPGFASGTGSIVQCADGGWSHSGGRSQACAGHGGER